MCNKMECLQINLYMDAHVIVFQLPYIYRWIRMIDIILYDM